MMAGFVVLGSCSIGLGAALNRVATTAKSAGPWLVMAAGAATAAAGVFRRDHMLLTGPGFAGESWHNQVHDVVSGVAYGAMLAAPLVLGRRFHADPDWAVLARPVQVLALASAVAMAVFASRAVQPWNGVVQRVAVTLAVSAEILVAARLLTLPRTGARAGAAATPPVTPSPRRRSSTKDLQLWRLREREVDHWYQVATRGDPSAVTHQPVDRARRRIRPLQRDRFY